jgi:hypothetical protein
MAGSSVEAVVPALIALPEPAHTGELARSGSSGAVCAFILPVEQANPNMAAVAPEASTGAKEFSILALLVVLGTMAAAKEASALTATTPSSEAAAGQSG